MKATLQLASLALPALLGLGLVLGQSPGPEPAPTAPEVVARIGEDEISLDEYKQHLFELFGLGALEDLVYVRLLEAEAASLGLAVTPEELDASWHEERRSMIARARGDERVMLETLTELGYTEETYRRRYEFSAKPALLEAKIARAQRTVSEEALLERFEFLYGVGGEKVVLRHLMLNHTRTRAERQAAGVTGAGLEHEAIEAAMDARGAELFAQLEAGVDFEALCRGASHDISVHQNGGVIPGYNYKHYGAEMAAAVRAAEVGALVAPFRSSAGLHLIRVEERTVTKLEDVRESLVTELMASDATYQERGALKLRLFREGNVSAPSVVGSHLLQKATEAAQR
ncbi:MAG: peptidylprolyl isomerase [Planctomycetota bacterium]|nr:peptidylprolyl isomerase [Planctomycetota bacterium]